MLDLLIAAAAATGGAVMAAAITASYYRGRIDSLLAQFSDFAARIDRLETLVYETLKDAVTTLRKL